MSEYSRREMFALLWRKPAESSDSGPGYSAQVRLPPKELLPPYLRPPGAGDENDFVKTCTGCGECKKACPEEAILPLGEAYGDAKDTPCVLPSMAACRLCEDQPCVAACEPGALRLTPLPDIRMGTLKVVTERCWAAMGQPCDYCITACPLPTPAIGPGEKGVVFDHERCIGCGLCLYYCTASPRAIEIVPNFHDPAQTGGQS